MVHHCGHLLHVIHLLTSKVTLVAETDERQAPGTAENQPAPVTKRDVPPAVGQASRVEQTVRAWHDAGRSQRAMAQELSINRRKVKHIIDQAA